MEVDLRSRGTWVEQTEYRFKEYPQRVAAVLNRMSSEELLGRALSVAGRDFTREEVEKYKLAARKVVTAQPGR